MNENRFDNKGEIYTKYRPSYPVAFIDYLYSDLEVNKDSIIADIAAGTGKLTKLLLEKGNKVFAVEPNSDMRRVMEKELGRFDNLISVQGTAEATNLNDNSINYITVGQAFHWFDHRLFYEECKRVLTDKGSIVLVWNMKDEENEIIKENYNINQKYCEDFHGFTAGMRPDENDNKKLKEFFQNGFESKIFNSDITFDRDAFIGRNLSSSYSPKENDSVYEEYISELGKLFDKHSVNGIIVIPNFTKSYAGTI